MTTKMVRVEAAIDSGRAIALAGGMRLSRKRLREAFIVVAETSDLNPNVLYEVGFAHGAGTATVLLARDVSTLPFDISGVNHIVYASILDLRDKLERRFRAVMSE